MKNIFYLLLLGICSLVTIGCKTDTAPVESPAQDSSVNVIKPHEPKEAIDNSLLAIIKNTTKITPAQVSPMVDAAKVILDYRYKETGKKAFIALDKDLWEYEFIYTGKNMTKPGQLAGSWIDFAEDCRYTYGYYEQTQGSGRYTFSIDTGLLLLIDDKSDMKPQEFETRIFDQSLILDGNDIYKDNNYNAKLKRITEKPMKIG